MARSREYGAAVIDSRRDGILTQEKILLQREEYPAPRYLGDTPEEDLINEGLLPSEEIFDHRSEIMGHLIGFEPRDEPEIVTFRINRRRNRKSK